jgi:hypothetical protein
VADRVICGQQRSCTLWRGPNRKDGERGNHKRAYDRHTPHQKIMGALRL